MFREEVTYPKPHSLKSVEEPVLELRPVRLGGKGVICRKNCLSRRWRSEMCVCVCVCVCKGPESGLA